MRMLKVHLDAYAYKPLRAHKWDAGLDLRSPIDRDLRPGDRVIIDTGVHVAIPRGHVGLILGRSSFNVLGILTDGVIDSGYTGSIRVALINTGDKIKCIIPGDKIAQLVIVPCRCMPVQYVARLPDTERGTFGFGSSGR